MNFLCLLDLRENCHYSLERLPSIKRALVEENVEYINIYDVPDIFYCDDLFENRNFITHVIDRKVNIIFTSSEIFEFIHPDTFLYLKKQGVKISGVLGDDENNFHININYLRVFDVPVAYQALEYKKYSVYNKLTYHLPIGISFFQSEQYDAVEKTVDIVFVGKPYGVRPKIVKKIIKEYDIKVYGSSEWLRYIPKKNYYGFVDNLNYYNTLASAKIVLAMLESKNNNKLLHINAKPFDAAKVGSALLVTSYKSFEVDYNLDSTTDYYVYDNENDICNAIQRALNDENIKLKAISYRNKIKNSFDYDSTYKYFFERLKNLVSKSSPEILDAEQGGAVVVFVDNIRQLKKLNENDFDYYILKNKNYKYCKSIENILHAHKGSGHPVRFDSYYKNKIARKRFLISDYGSVAFPSGFRPTLILGLYFGLSERAYLPGAIVNKFSLISSVIVNLKALRDRFSV